MPGSDNHIITDIKAPVVKATTALGAAGAANTSFAENVATEAARVAADQMQNPELFWAIMALPWGTFAQMAAAFYTAFLMLEWMWKKICKPVAVYFKWIKPEKKLTVTQWAELAAKQDRE